MWLVYLVEIDNKFYVGVTSKGLDWRMRRHKVEARRDLTKTVFHNKLAKYIDEAKWTEIVITDSKENALKLEKAYIKQYACKFPNGYNLTDGGEGVWGHSHTEETKNKISRANAGRKHSKKSKQLMSKNRKGKSTGKQSTQRRENKAKQMGTEEFNVFTRDNKYIGTWKNKSQCSRDLNISRNTIIRGLKQSSNYYNIKYIFKVKNGKI